MDNVAWEETDAVPEGGSMAAVRTDGGGGGGGEPLKRIRWDRFLPRRSLRVLLVEHDDSTRHIVAALLRKCSYQVAAVADGLKAWEVMKEKSFSFDLVLTEFEMPSLSGIGLLGKIVGTEGCKNIPVIMMSSHDSVGIVHKCMLKGAADFLVKPLRKNELRNLWQHVWRRHCSSSYACASEQNAASNHISSNAGDWSQTGETSDKGSDADQILGCKLGTKVGISQNQAEPVLAKHGQSPREAEAHPEHHRNDLNTMVDSSALDDNWALRDKTLIIGDVAVQPSKMALLVENSGHTSHVQDDLVSLRCAKSSNEKPNLHNQINSQEEPAQCSDGLMKSLSNGQCSHNPMKTAVMDENVSVEAARSSQMKHIFSPSTLPLWELSLMTQLNGGVQHDFKQNNILNHSNASAFSRYGGSSPNSAGKSNSSSTCNRNKEYEYGDQPQSHLSCCGTDTVKCSLPASAIEGVEQCQISSDGNMEEVGDFSSDAQPQNAYSSRNDIALHSQLGFLPLPIPVGAVPYTSFCTGYGEVLRPIIYQDSPLTVQNLAVAENGPSKIYFDCSKQLDENFASHSGSIEFRCNDLNHPLPCRGQVNDTGGVERRDFSCNHVEEDILKGDGSNGSDDATTNAAATTGTSLEGGNESSIQNCNKNGTNSDLSHREAALIKFRLKRKERCFAKKVRYHSRQKLAEQRPRVKGQFVSQKILELSLTQETDG
ncbi:hypothetical protein KFK09_023253 [Dendrobium nobile]|uniref:Two-component response regulator-like PRR95 n=1 Tax=Dendrobium nobile TaxID=94219 RepID=A0A8T3AL03_DENNO|nr:hypothetical protein KFK09_023253 [Dendrobium nobile]